jgi:hypothetical protein
MNRLLNRVKRLQAAHPPGRCWNCRDWHHEWVLFPKDPEPTACPYCGFTPTWHRLRYVVIGWAHRRPYKPTLAQALSAQEQAQWREQHPGMDLSKFALISREREEAIES